MRLDNIITEVLKISLCYGTATRHERGIEIYSAKLNRGLLIPNQTVNHLVDDEATLDAISKMATGANIPVSVFNPVCNRLHDIKRVTPHPRLCILRLRNTRRS